MLAPLPPHTHLVFGEVLPDACSGEVLLPGHQDLPHPIPVLVVHRQVIGSLALEVLPWNEGEKCRVSIIPIFY